MSISTRLWRSAQVPLVNARLLVLAAGPAALVSLAADSPIHYAHFPDTTPVQLPVCAEPYDGVRTEGVEFLVAVAGEDTVPVGDGLFGQVAEVQRIESDASAEFSGTAVLLVPWGVDDDCSPIPWTGTWRWYKVGEAGFFRGSLLTQEVWVAGQPTLDVYGAVWEGFPGSPWDHPMQGRQPKLSADDLFDLYQLLPTLAEIAERPYSAVSDLVDWRRNAGDKVIQYPARAILESAFYIAELARIRKSPIPFAGTYRVHLEVNGEIMSTFFLRIGEGATAPIGRPAIMDMSEVISAPMPTGAFVAPVALALSAGALDSMFSGERPSECKRPMGLYGAEDETGVEGAAKAWKAELPLNSVAGCFVKAAFLKDLRAEQDSMVAVDQLGVESFTGFFRQEDDGRFTFRQTGSLGDGVIVNLVGERIGLETLPRIHPTSRSGS
jgi:hypothetical protein